MVLVVANGDLEEGDWIRPYLQQAQVIVAVDGGLSHLESIEVMPHYLIGDQDSLTAAQETAPEFTDIKQITHPTAKDETDLELALLHVCAEFPEAEIIIVAGFGGRLDQTLANLLLLAHPRLQSSNIKLVTPHQRAWLLTTAVSSTQITGQKGDLVSLLPLGGDVTVAHTEGLAWPLHDEILAFGPARGVSNRLTATTASVAITAGYLLVVHTDRAWGR
jgi:thiamine pyrophosphokinase